MQRSDGLKAPHYFELVLREQRADFRDLGMGTLQISARRDKALLAVWVLSVRGTMPAEVFIVPAGYTLL